MSIEIGRYPNEPEVTPMHPISPEQIAENRVIEVRDNGEVEEFDLSQLEKQSENEPRFLDFEPGQQVNAGKIYGDPGDPTGHFRWEVLGSKAAVDKDGKEHPMIKIGSPLREDGTRLDVTEVNPDLLAQLQPRFNDGDSVKGPDDTAWVVRSQGKNGRVVISSPARPAVGRVVDAAELYLMQS